MTWVSLDWSKKCFERLIDFKKFLLVCKHNIMTNHLWSGEIFSSFIYIQFINSMALYSTQKKKKTLRGPVCLHKKKKHARIHPPRIIKEVRCKEYEVSRDVHVTLYMRCRVKGRRQWCPPTLAISNASLFNCKVGFLVPHHLVQTQTFWSFFFSFFFFKFPWNDKTPLTT